MVFISSIGEKHGSHEDPQMANEYAYKPNGRGRKAKFQDSLIPDWVFLGSLNQDSLD
jgi:hypothetical protein